MVVIRKRKRIKVENIYIVQNEPSIHEHTMRYIQTNSIETRVTTDELFIYIKIVNKYDLFLQATNARIFENDFQNAPDDSCNLIASLAKNIAFSETMLLLLLLDFCAICVP